MIICLASLSIPGFSQRLIDSLEFIYENQEIKDTSYVQVLNDLTLEYLHANRAGAQDMILEAMRLSDSLNYKTGKFWATVNRGNTFWFAGMYDAALNWFLRARQMTDDQMTFPRLAIYNNIGEVFKRKSQFDSALVYLNLAKDIAKDQNLHSEEVLLLYNISELYLKINNLELAEDFISRSVSRISSATNPRYEAYAWFGKGEIAERKGQLEDAIEYHLKAHSIRKEANDIAGQVTSLNKLAKIYMNMGDFTHADQFIAESLSLSESSRNQNYMSQTYLVKAEFMKETRKLEEANEWLMKHFSMKESLDQTAFTDQVERIKEALNAEIKEKDFQLLEQQQNTQYEVIKRQTWIIISISVLAIVLLVFFLNYRKSLKSEKHHSDALNELNNIIINKNKKIKQINATLDHQLINTTKLLFESQKIAKIGSWEYNLETGEVLWTDETYQKLGLASEEEESYIELIKEHVSEESVERVDQAKNLPGKDGLISEETIRLQLENGQEKFFRIRHFAEGSEGTIVRAYGSSQDITDLVKTEENEKAVIQALLNLSQHANLLDHDFEDFLELLLKQATELLEVVGAIFWIYDEQNKFLQCVKVHGVAQLQPGDQLGTADFPKYFEEVQKNRTLPVTDLGAHKSTQILNAQFYQKIGIQSMLDSKLEIDGKWIGLFSVVHDLPRKWTYSDQRFVGSLTDIITTAYSTSLKKKLEREKGDLIKKLLKRNENLEELTYVISHHLRGPLTRIIGLSDLYNDPQSKGIEDEIMKRINQSSHELDQVMKDLIEIIKYSDEQTLTEEILLKDIIEATLKEVRSEWPKVKTDIQISIAKGISVFGNTSQIQNILYALISNAYKFRNKDRELEIRIDARKVSGMIQIAIADNGMGIDLTRFDNKIFKMYQRFHTDIPGMGIGLFITKNLVEAMGGRIDVNSLPMDGTVFTVELPDHAPLSISNMKLTDVA